MGEVMGFWELSTQEIRNFVCIDRFLPETFFFYHEFHERFFIWLIPF